MKRLFLKRFSATKDGTWGVFCSEDHRPLFFTAEIPNTFLRPGVYTCKLQTHYSANGSSYPAYEILNVIDASGKLHSDVEIHIANIPERDLKGCVAVGMQAGPSDKGWGVWFSTKAHYNLLDYLNYASEFYLEITEQV